ncbi:MAG: hypothetical protein HY960_03080 [Ignavibacteriae bacterium]|nr:hypothetical protein [Ignavibacteriota bacterium]
MSIPKFRNMSDERFNTTVTEIKKELVDNSGAYQITDTDKQAVDNDTNTWSGDYGTHLSAQSAARAATVKKDDSREKLTKTMSSVLKKVNQNDAIPADQKIKVGITQSDSTPTASPKPSTRPMFRIDTSTHLQHTIHFFDETTPKSKGKPKGVLGCMIYRKIGGPAPVDETEMSFLVLDTATPYVVTFNASDVGKTVYYLGWWQNTTGQPGPKTEIVSAVIA